MKKAERLSIEANKEMQEQTKEYNNLVKKSKTMALEKRDTKEINKDIKKLEIEMLKIRKEG